MQKFLVIIALVLLSSIAAAAQTAEEQQRPLSGGKQVEFAKRAETERTLKPTGAPALNGKTKTVGKRGEAVSVVDGRVIRFGPSTTYLKNGLRTEEVIRLLGKPASVSERQDGSRLLSTYTFNRSGGRIFIAEFENDVLVRSRTEAAAASE